MAALHSWCGWMREKRAVSCWIEAISTYSRIQQYCQQSSPKQAAAPLSLILSVQSQLSKNELTLDYVPGKAAVKRNWNLEILIPLLTASCISWCFFWMMIVWLGSLLAWSIFAYAEAKHHQRQRNRNDHDGPFIRKLFSKLPIYSRRKRAAVCLKYY